MSDVPLITGTSSLDLLTEAGLSPTAPITSSDRPFFWQQIERIRAALAITDTVAAIKHARVTLTDAQIKALPTTPITLIAAPGANLRLDVVFATYRAKTASGAYTNINTTYAAMALYWLGDFSQWATVAIVNDSAPTPDITALSGFIGAAATQSARLIPYHDSPGGWVVPNVTVTSAISDNKALAIAIDNNGSGVLTGGNAANSLQVDVFYTVSTAA